MEGLIFALMASMFWGVNGILLRIGFEKEDVFSSTMTVVFVSSLITFMAAARDIGRVEIIHENIVLLIAAGFISYFLGRLITYRSIPIVGSSRAYSASSTRILFSAILGVLILREEMNSFILSGTAFMILGLYLFTTEKINVREFYISISSGLFFGIASLLIKKGMLESVFLSLAIATLSGFVFLSIFCALTDRFVFVRNKYILLSAGTLTAGNILFYHALKVSPLIIAIPLSNLYPIITTFIGYLVIKELERINLKTISASAITVLGSVLISVGYLG